MSGGIVDPCIESQRCAGCTRRALSFKSASSNYIYPLFNPNLHLLVTSIFFSTLIYIQSFPSIHDTDQDGTALRRPPVRITTVINNHVYDSKHRRSPVINNDMHDNRHAHIAPLHLGLCADYNGIPHHRLNAVAAKRRRKCMAQIALVAWHTTEQVH